MTSGEVTGIIAVIGTALSFLGVTGIDATMVSSAVNGVIAIVAFAAALWTWYKHKQVVNQ